MSETEREPTAEDELPAENFVDALERAQANDPQVGDGTPAGAPALDDDDYDVDSDDAPEGNQDEEER